MTSCLSRYPAALLLLLSACGTGEPREGSPVPSVEAWGLAVNPEFLVPGGLHNGDSIHFTAVANGEFVDGTVAISLARGQNSVVLLNPAGQVARVLGGRGDGPQEFRSVPQLFRAGDRLVALDRTRRRYLEVVGSAFGEAVGYDRGLREIEVGLLEDGSVFTAQDFPSLPTLESHTERRTVTPYYVRIGAAADTIAGPSSPPQPNLILAAAPGGMATMAAPECLPSSLHAGTGSALLIADASTGVVMSLSRTGAVDTLYQSQDDRGVVTQAMVDRAEQFITARATRLQESPGFRPEGFLESIGRVGDPLRSVWRNAHWDGRFLWLQRAIPCLFGDDEAAPQVWDVINVESRSRVAVVDVPAALRLLAVNSGRALAVTGDALDVEHVGIYRIIR